MNKIIKYILIAFVFVLLMGGAYFAYGKLSETYTPEIIGTGNGDVENIQPEELTEKPEIKEEDGVTTEVPKNGEIFKAPDFTVIDYNGNNVNLSDFFGKPIVVNFWATWCSSCKMQLPNLNALAEEYKDEVVFMMVNLEGGRNSIDEVKDFVEKSGYTFPVYFDTKDSAYKTYGLTSIPRSLFIKPNGEISLAIIGIMDEISLRNSIEKLFEQKGN